MNQDKIQQNQKRSRLTVIVPTFNEEKNIRECLESVNWADEIFVVDSFSEDRTVEIAAKFTDRVVQHEYVNSAFFFNYAATTEIYTWIMIVDADERVTKALKNEILDILEKDGDGFDGFYIYRINHFLGKRIRHCGWDRDKVLRLFRRDNGRYQDREVHADVILEGKSRALEHKLLHYTYSSFEHFLKKMDRYTSWAAGDRGRKTKKVRWHHLTLRPAFRFFKQYVMRLGFLDGREGLILCSLAAYSVFLKYAKLYEKHKFNE